MLDKRKLVTLKIYIMKTIQNDINWNLILNIIKTFF